MKGYKLVALVGGAVGYVLGTKAGRARYDQIRRTAEKVMGDPRVRDVAHQAQEQVTHAAEKVRHRAGEMGSDTGSGSGSGTASGAGGAWPEQAAAMEAQNEMRDDTPR